MPDNEPPGRAGAGPVVSPPLPSRRLTAAFASPPPPPRRRRPAAVGFTFLNAEPEANEFYAVSMKDTDSLKHLVDCLGPWVTANSWSVLVNRPRNSRDGLAALLFLLIDLLSSVLLLLLLFVMFLRFSLFC